MKNLTVYVNGEAYEVLPERMSYERIVGMAFPDAADDSRLVVLWRIPDGSNTMGIMAPGMTVEPVDKMNIYVSFAERT